MTSAASACCISPTASGTASACCPRAGRSTCPTLAPAQPASYFEGGPGYGAQFWVHGGREGLPDVAYAANGAGGQYAMIIPSANLVVVRRGLDVDSDFNVAKFSADVLEALEQ